MEYQTLDINVISAKDLKKVNLISKMRAYAIVSISGDPSGSQEQRTAVDRRGNANPTWNFPVKFNVSESAALSNRFAVTFRIRCERSLGDKDIGELHVPLSEFIQSVEDGKIDMRYLPGIKGEVIRVPLRDGTLISAKYLCEIIDYVHSKGRSTGEETSAYCDSLRSKSGKPQGELNLSYKWSKKIVGATVQPAMEVNKAQEPVKAIPAQVGSSSADPPPPTRSAYQSQDSQQSSTGLGLGTASPGGALGGLLIGDIITDGSRHGGCGGGCGGSSSSHGGGGGCGGGGCGGGGGGGY